MLEQFFGVDRATEPTQDARHPREALVAPAKLARRIRPTLSRRTGADVPDLGQDLHAQRAARS